MVVDLILIEENLGYQEENWNAKIAVRLSTGKSSGVETVEGIKYLLVDST